MQRTDRTMNTTCTVKGRKQGISRN